RIAWVCLSRQCSTASSSSAALTVSAGVVAGTGVRVLPAPDRPGQSGAWRSGSAEKPAGQLQKQNRLMIVSPVPAAHALAGAPGCICRGSRCCGACCTCRTWPGTPGPRRTACRCWSWRRLQRLFTESPYKAFRVTELLASTLPGENQTPCSKAVRASTLGFIIPAGELVRDFLLVEPISITAART